MENYRLSKRSEDNLIGVHPQLVSVVRRGLILSPVDFTVVEGLRTIERQRQLLAQGVSKTLNSRHIKGEAVDLYPYYDGKVQIPKSSHNSWFLIAEAMAEAAEEQGVRITWGGHWVTIIDMPHYQIELG